MLVSNVTWIYIQAYSFYRKNLLPNGASFLKESQKYIDAMFVLDKEYSLIEQDQVKKAKT